MLTRVFVTVDTESSMGGAWRDPNRRPVTAGRHVFCRIGDTAYGIPLMVDELSRYGMKAVFFCEMFATYVLGEEDTRSVVDYLLEAGQDVQLHLHPTFRFYAHYREALAAGTGFDRASVNDRMSSLPETVQGELIEEGCEVFRRFTGRRPLAYRAGGYAANHATLKVLRLAGIHLDSSYNPAFLSNNSFRDRPLEPNLVQRIEGVWELPVTVARTAIREGAYKPFEISAIGNWEMERILEHAHENGMENVVIVFHSFSMVKPRDIAYSEFRPNHIVIRRFRRLLRYLDRNRYRYRVATFGELASDPGQLEKPHKAAIAHLGFLQPALRKVGQAANRLYWT